MFLRYLELTGRKLMGSACANTAQSVHIKFILFDFIRGFIELSLGSFD